MLFLKKLKESHTRHALSFQPVTVLEASSLALSLFVLDDGFAVLLIAVMMLNEVVYG